MKNEDILVLRREDLAAYLTPGYQALSHTQIEQLTQLIRDRGMFLPRALMEEDERYLQIIPYIAYTVNGKVFVMQRSAQASEQRLASKLSIGIGGHVRAEDMTESSIVAWAQREFAEEVFVNVMPEFEIKGIIYDPSNAVGRVHIGIFMVARGTSEDIAVKSELKSGELWSLAEHNGQLDNFENWSMKVLGCLALQS